MPANIDGVSFLPQLRGEKGKSREWLYTWYSPRQNKNMAVRECAFDQRFKLYRTGQFYDLSADEMEKKDLDATTLSGDAVAVKAKLQGVLDQFENARPAELDKQFLESGDGPGKSGKKKNKKNAK